MKKYYTLIYAVITFLFIFNQGAIYAQLTAGDLAFIAYNSDGDDDFAIVTFADLQPMTNLYFSDNEVLADGSFNSGEGFLHWQSGSQIVLAGTVIIFTDVDSNTNPNFGAYISGALSGTLTRVFGPFALNGSQDSILAYTGISYDNLGTYIAGVEGAFGAVGDLTNTGLSYGLDFVSYAATGSPDGGYYNFNRDTEINFADYLPLVNNNAHWTLEQNNGELILPINNTSFSLTTLGVDDLIFDQLNIYFANDQLNINGLPFGLSIEMTLYNIQGQKLLQKNFISNGLEYFDLLPLTGGVHFVHIVTGSTKVGKKILLY